MSVRRASVQLIGVALLASALIAGKGGALGTDDRGSWSAVADRLQDRRCPVTKLPDPLPDIATVVDADTLRRSIAVELAGSSTTGTMLFSIRFGEDGRIEWVERIGKVAADLPLQSRVQGLIAAHAKAQPSSREPWSLRLQVAPGDSVRLRLSHSEVCPATRIADGGPPTGSGVGSMSMEEIAELRRAGSFRIGVDISAIGEVLRVELLQSSGSRFQDDFALQRARGARYRPALVDGIPVAARYEIRSGATVRVRTRSTTRSRPD